MLRRRPGCAAPPPAPPPPTPPGTPERVFFNRAARLAEAKTPLFTTAIKVDGADQPLAVYDVRALLHGAPACHLFVFFSSSPVPLFFVAEERSGAWAVRRAPLARPPPPPAPAESSAPLAESQAAHSCCCAQGDSPYTVAAAFGAKHGLPAEAVDTVAKHIMAKAGKFIKRVRAAATLSPLAAWQRGPSHRSASCYPGCCSEPPAPNLLRSAVWRCSSCVWPGVLPPSVLRGGRWQVADDEPGVTPLLPPSPLSTFCSIDTRRKPPIGFAVLLGYG